jgi:hypothetical protein
MFMTHRRFALVAVTTLALLAAPAATSQAFFDDEPAGSCNVTASANNTACYDGLGAGGTPVHNCMHMTAQNAAQAADALNCTFVNNTPTHT